METSTQLLQTEIEAIKFYIPKWETKNEAVSAVDVGWHLWHTLKVINAICNALQNSDPSQYKKSFNLKRVAVFNLNAIPRGKGKAPKPVRPPENVSLEDINQQMQKTVEKLSNYSTLDSGANFDHPVFGLLDKKQTLKFLKIHTNHHLKIIKDILNK